MKVVFETGNCYIQDKTRAIKTPIEERNGASVFDLRRPKCQVNQERANNMGRLQALMENEENGNEGFVRQAGPS